MAEWFLTRCHYGCHGPLTSKTKEEKQRKEEKKPTGLLWSGLFHSFNGKVSLVYSIVSDNELRLCILGRPVMGTMFQEDIP